MANDFAYRYKGNPLRIGTWDIEALGLKAQWAYTTCISIKHINEHNLLGKTTTFRIDDYDYKKEQDRGLLNDTFRYMDDHFDLLVGWYTSRFDFPFTQTRGNRYGFRVKPPEKRFRRDLCLCARGFSALNNNRLATHDKWVNGYTLKTQLTFEQMLGAIRGEKWAIDEYVDHCERDVLSTEKVYKKEMQFYGKLKRG